MKLVIDYLLLGSFSFIEVIVVGRMQVYIVPKGWVNGRIRLNSKY